MTLTGKRVVVTRASRQAATFVTRLEELGATVVEVPSIEIVDPGDGGVALVSAFGRIGDYEWLVATSVNTVERIARFLPVDIGVAAIGPATAEALGDLGVTVEIVPPSYVAESLVEVFPSGHGKVLLPRAERARDVLPLGLRAKGWSVDVVTAYRTVAAGAPDGAIDAVESADVVTFTASSTVENFVDTYGTPPAGTLVACIGPVTASTARRLGMRVDIEAAEHTIDGLIEALSRH